MRHRHLVAAVVAATCLAIPTGVAAHELDHVPPRFSATAPPQPGFLSGGEPGTKWEMIATIPTGNLQSDLDFFETGGETYASVGTLGAGANSAGQTVVQLTDKDKVAPKVVTSHPSATCIQNEAAALGLQHDVEATPKGNAILNSVNPVADSGDTQLLIDATDANGRCHDAMRAGGDGFGLVLPDKQGGLELIDVTEIGKPKEIGLTSHIGESHTVNVDPKRPHIAYSVTSDFVSVATSTNASQTSVKGRRTNETNPARIALDGFEVVDMSSCMNFPAGTTIAQKRDACKPEVYRYRYPTKEMALGHEGDARGVYGCHELEIYPDDRITCGGGNAAITLDVKDAFDDNGTPNDFSDDKPKGKGGPLPCSRRNSATTTPGFMTGAKVVDCVTGEKDGQPFDLKVKNWLDNGSPGELEGVKFLGSAYHMGRDGTRNATQDIDFNHETELTTSGNFLIATDERGGGVLPPGASCSPGADLTQGNGGIHAYRTDKLQKIGADQRDADGKFPADVAFDAYAKTPEGGKAIFRVPVRTQPQGSTCTAHVMQQIPGQNRIFMGWYSQGTQVVDFIEGADGTLKFENAGFFIPGNANTWVSHIFKVEENADGSFTYFGATGDFLLGAGRNAIDVYKVTLPAPQKSDGPFGQAPQFPKGDNRLAPPPQQPQQQQQQQQQQNNNQPQACQSRAGFISASAKGAGRSGALDFTFRRRVDEPVTVDIFQQSRGRKVTGEKRVKRFENRTGAFRWNGRDEKGRKVPNGIYFARFRVEAPGGQADTVRVTLGRSNGRFGPRRAFYRRDSCGTLKTFKLSRPVFGGTRSNKLGIAYRLNQAARVQVTVTNRRERTIRRFAAKQVSANQTQRLTLSPKGLARGDYRVKLSVTQGGRTTTSVLTANRL